MVNDQTAHRRRYVRRRVLKRGVLKIEGCEGEFSGLVRDISDGGVRFVLDHPDSVPRELRLPVPARLDLGSVHNLVCDVVRSADPSLGISFADPTPITLSNPVDLNEFYRVLESLPAVIEHFRSLDFDSLVHHLEDVNYFNSKDLTASMREFSDAHQRLRSTLNDLARLHGGAKAGWSSTKSGRIGG